MIDRVVLNDAENARRIIERDRQDHRRALQDLQVAGIDQVGREAGRKRVGASEVVRQRAVTAGADQLARRASGVDVVGAARTARIAVRKRIVIELHQPRVGKRRRRVVDGHG